MNYILRAFSEIEEGQIHYRTCNPEERTQNKPLLMFHPSPLSSLFLMPLAKILGRTRRVIAFDTPGQGDSCPPSTDSINIDEIADGPTCIAKKNWFMLEQMANSNADKPLPPKQVLATSIRVGKAYYSNINPVEKLIK